MSFLTHLGWTTRRVQPHARGAAADAGHRELPLQRSDGPDRRSSTHCSAIRSRGWNVQKWPFWIGETVGGWCPRCGLSWCR